MATSRFARKAGRTIAAVGTFGVLAVPAAHAIVSAELRVGPPERSFPATAFDSSVLGDSFGAKELVMQGLPTTRAAVEGNLSSGILRAVAQTDYFRAEYDPTGFSDSYTGASAKVTMGDTVTFNNVAIGAVGHLDLLVTGGFSTVPDARRIPWGTASASAGVTSEDRRVTLFRTKWFAADAASRLKLPQYAWDESIVGGSVSYLDTLSFELLPGTYRFFWELEARGTGYDADFGSTAHAYLRLPEGVTYTSQSGVFLATAQPLSPVPLPPMLHQVLLGLGLLVGWFRYRRPKRPGSCVVCKPHHA